MDCWQEAQEALAASWGKDTIFALGTRAGEGVNVRNVDGYYMNGAVYVTSYALSHKMREIAVHPAVGLCAGLSVAQGVGENLGHPLDPKLTELRDTLRRVFSAFYGKHTNEKDENTCILRVQLTEAVLFARDKRYAIDFVGHTATSTPCIPDIIAPENGG